MAVNAGMPINVAAERFGHSPSVMLSIYTHTTCDSARRGRALAAASIDNP